MKTSVAVACTLAAAVSAQASGFGAIAARSGSPIHLQDINANGGNLWIGKPTTTYCPPISGLECPVGNNETVFAGAQAGSNGQLGLDVEVPGGQFVYIAPSGAVSFTQAHSASIPEGSIYDGWTHTEGSSFGQLSNSAGIIFCPQGADGGFPYQMFAQIDGVTFPDSCLGADLLTVNVTGFGAWQYV